MKTLLGLILLWILTSCFTAILTTIWDRIVKKTNEFTVSEHFIFSHITWLGLGIFLLIFCIILKHLI